MHKFFLAAVLLAFFSIEGGAMALEIKSSAFSNEGNVPSKYTCDGQDVSPPLNFSGAPAGTKSLTLISDDPDAPMGTWVHWVVWNIPPTSTGLKEGIEPDLSLPDGTRQGITDFKRAGYGGPCPPSGTHRYYFKLYALDSELQLPPSATKADLESAMKGHILATASLMGTYNRKK